MEENGFTVNPKYRSEMIIPKYKLRLSNTKHIECICPSR